MASQLANYQSALDAQQVQSLFASDVNTGSSALVNVLA
jgi:chromosome condensin MukBEF ATPase and DNA-binding subunit MukB